MDLVPQRQEIAIALLTLETASGRLIDALSHRPISAIVEGETNGRSCDAYATIDYGMTDDVNTSLVCLGPVGVNAETEPPKLNSPAGADA